MSLCGFSRVKIQGLGIHEPCTPRRSSPTNRRKNPYPIPIPEGFISPRMNPIQEHEPDLSGGDLQCLQDIPDPGSLAHFQDTGIPLGLVGHVSCEGCKQI
jgi:hypothetical protein